MFITTVTLAVVFLLENVRRLSAVYILLLQSTSEPSLQNMDGFESVYSIDYKNSVELLYITF